MLARQNLVTVMPQAYNKSVYDDYFCSDVVVECAPASATSIIANSVNADILSADYK